jgi:hypothetical protein
MIPVTVVVLVQYRDLYSGSTPPSSTNHATLSLNMALNARFCGTVGRLSSRYSPYVFLTKRADLMSHPFEETIAAEAGSLAEYCRTVTEPYVVSENSLMWLARLALGLDRDLTADGLGRFLASCRMLMLAVFGFALIRTGSPVLLTLAAVLVGCAILRGLGVRDTTYPFVLTLPLLHAAAYGLASASRFARNRRVALWTFTFGMGILTAYSASTRTILLPMSLAMFGVFLFALFKARDPSQAVARSVTLIAVATVAFGLGYAGYVRIFIELLRFKNNAAVSDYAYHTVAHPLVLGLAVPESSFSQREGIRWDDMVGLTLAQRVAPGVDLLGSQYETALLRYYGRLWRKHPRDMAMVYAQKLRSAGSGVFLSAANIGAEFGFPCGPAEWMHRVMNGVVLLAFGVVTFGIALVRQIRHHSSRMLIIALISVAGLAALGEAFLMYSLFMTIYYSELLFFVLFAFLISVQAAGDLVARTILRTRDPHVRALS